MTSKTAPPYYAVIFSNQTLNNPPPSAYAAMADRMCELAKEQPGYLGFESARNQDGFAISVSYWRDLESIRNWKQVSEHLVAQEKGKTDWYANYRVRVCRVEKDYGWETEPA